MLEMTDCKYFSYNEIIKNKRKRNKITLKVINCSVGIGDMRGCQKYCPLYEKIDTLTRRKF